MRATDWPLLVLLSVLWGATYPFIAVANPEVSPFTLVLGRVALAALALVPLVFVLGMRLPATAARWWPFVLQAVVPVTATALGVLFLDETLTRHQIAGALVIASGLVMIDGRPPGWLGRRSVESRVGR